MLVIFLIIGGVIYRGLRGEEETAPMVNTETLVGGIGVMNIMLVIVKERTEEIGLRMALGAAKQEIRKQFLLEAVFLSLMGGIIGVVVGSGFSYAVNYVILQFQESWEIVIPFWVIGVSFGITVLIGIIFGYYPAYKASKLDPINALRYE